MSEMDNIRQAAPDLTLAKSHANRIKYSSKVTKLVALEPISDEPRHETQKRALEMLLKTMQMCECRGRYHTRFDKTTG